MGKSWRLHDLMMNLLLVAAVAAIWLAFAPAQLGGQVTYVLVNGISMEPGFHTGDLALMRPAASYQVGDIVAYHDAIMNAEIIHRIFGMDQDRFIMKGDNNSWIDEYRPAPAEIAGKLWLHLPKFGTVLLWARSPINTALTAALIGGLLMVNMIVPEPNQKVKRKRKAVSVPPGMFEMGLYTAGFLALVFLALAIFAFTRPVTRTADKVPYEQTGNFFYTASGAPGVYDSGSASSGQPVFTKLTCTLNLGFVYSLAADSLEAVSGRQYFDASVLDLQSGWKRTIPLTSAAQFNGPGYVGKTNLDLCQLQSLVASVEQKTGIRLNSYTLVITAHVAVAGKISGQALADTFDPNLTFNFDGLHFYMAADASKTDPMKTVKDGLISSTAQVNNTFKLFGLYPTVAMVRTVSGIGLLVCLVGLLGLGYNFYMASKRNPQAVITMKYGPILMDIQDQGLETLSPAIDVTSIDDLAKLAGRQNAMILHMKRDSADYYYIQIEGTTYRYITDANQAIGSA
jgi:signal peptidase I